MYSVILINNKLTAVKRINAVGKILILNCSKELAEKIVRQNNKNR